MTLVLWVGISNQMRRDPSEINHGCD